MRMRAVSGAAVEEVAAPVRQTMSGEIGRTGAVHGCRRKDVTRTNLRANARTCSEGGVQMYLWVRVGRSLVWMLKRDEGELRALNVNAFTPSPQAVFLEASIFF